MQIIVESVDRVNSNDRGISSRIKSTTGDYIFVNEDATKHVGKLVDIDVNEKTSQKGNRYKVGKITKVYEATAGTSDGNHNGKITWDAYRAMAEAAHSLAIKLEPDDPESWIDRSQARASIVNTTLSRYCEGKIFVPAEDDDIPPF